MGACSFQTIRKAKSMREAYNRACEDAKDEYGHQDGYNGTISTTSGFHDITDEFKRSGKKLQDFINKKIDDADKWGPAFGICMVQAKENKNKVKSQVEHVVTKGTKKWVLKFVVSDRSGNEIGSKNTKGDAVKLARAHTEKTQQSTSIHMEKKLDTGSSKVAEIKYKQSTSECNGQFVFFGMAAE